ncbi:MAG: hypothetical protein ACREIF_15070, partial [Chthoniobacterales bacterium]
GFPDQLQRQTAEGRLEKLRALKRLLPTLTNSGVDFILVGGVAGIVHGAARVEMLRHAPRGAAASRG